MAILLLDESGDEGFNLEAQNPSSEWFILGGVIQPAGTTDLIRDRYAEFRKTYRRQETWSFHFQRASHDERLCFIRHMSSLPYTALSVMVHKPSIQKRENLSKKYYLYFYAAKLLLENATIWTKKNSHRKLQIIFSSRGGLTAEQFKEYLGRIPHRNNNAPDYMAWEHLNLDGITCEENKNLIGLQMADYVASAAAKSVEIGPWGIFEDKYVRELRPMLMRYGNNPSARGFGVKIWPGLNGEISLAERLKWFRDI